jgi:hypothetical protein
MNTENIKEMAVKAKDKVAEFAYDHREEIAVLAGIGTSTFLAMVYGYQLGKVNTMATVIGNEQRIRYAEAAATPNIEVHTDIPKK